MTRDEILDKIDKVKDAIFLNQMNDHWSRDDYDYDTKKTNELRELEKMLEECQA